MATYAATKAGLSEFHETRALDLRGLPVGTTLVELGPIPTDMLDHVDAYQLTRSFDRGYRLRLIADVPRERVADEVVPRSSGTGPTSDCRAGRRLPPDDPAAPRADRLDLTGIRHRREP